MDWSTGLTSWNEERPPAVPLCVQGITGPSEVLNIPPQGQVLLKEAGGQVPQFMSENFDPTMQEQTVSSIRSRERPHLLALPQL